MTRNRSEPSARHSRPVGMPSTRSSSTPDDDLVRSLVESRLTLGAALVDTVVFVSDGSRTIRLGDVPDDAVLAFLNRLNDASRHVWFAPARIIRQRRDGIEVTEHDARGRLLELGVPAALTRPVRDAAAAVATLDPTAVRVPRRGEQTVDVFGIPEASSPERRAVGVALRVDALRRHASARARRAALVAAEHQAQWAERARRGHRIDIDLLREERDNTRRRRAELTEALGIDLVSSTKQTDRARIHGWLHEHGIVLQDRAGNPTLNRDDFDRVDIGAFSDDQRIAWQQFRTARSLVSRAAKLRELGNATVQGRVHGYYRVRGTVTGRATFVRPALQNIHRDLRPLLLADEGAVLVSLDLAQIEVRVAAAISEDDALTADVTGQDVYFEMAKRLFGVAAIQPDGTPDLAMRHVGKQVFLQVMYGAGARTIAMKLSEAGTPTTHERAEQLIRSLWTSYPTLAAFQATLRRQAAARAVLPLRSGRPGIVPPAGEHAALNAVLQAEAADYFLAAAHRVLNHLPAHAAWLGIHDELVLSVPPVDAEEAAGLLESEMTGVLNRIPVRGDAEILGRSWRK